MAAFCEERHPKRSLSEQLEWPLCFRRDVYYDVSKDPVRINPLSGAQMSCISCRLSRTGAASDRERSLHSLAGRELQGCWAQNGKGRCIAEKS